MAYPTNDDRKPPSELGPYGYEYPRMGADSAPSGRSILVMLGAIVAVLAVIALFSVTGTDDTTTASTTPSAPVEQSQPAEPQPAPSY